jgi:sialate O-acetylesterase
VPVGIIHSSWGGKPVETFTSREALASIPEGKHQLAQLDEACATYDPAKAAQQYQVALKRHQQALETWNKTPKAQRKRQPVKPTPPRNPAATEGKPAALYNGMIHPFAGYPMRGAIWYQGEANAKSPASASAYGKLFPLMINNWRKRWNDEFSFLWVQLANFKAPAAAPGAVDPWAQLQDEQRKTLSFPKTGMAVINDIGAATDIHPKNKKEVGRRLAQWALAADYGKKVTPCGPLYQSHEIAGAAVRVRFQYGAGLKSRDGGPLKRFEIAGKDQVWHWAQAKIDGDSVLVSSPEVPQPAAVRYAWCSNPEGANLVNGDTLPASVFRTDDWPVK